MATWQYFVGIIFVSAIALSIFLVVDSWVTKLFNAYQRRTDIMIHEQRYRQNKQQFIKIAMNNMCVPYRLSDVEYYCKEG